MSCNERTALLATQQGHQQQQQHIIVVPATRKDPKDYEPIFTTADYSYGLTLEELLPFALDPWWQNVRRLSCGILGLAFLVTLIAGLSLAYAGSVCQPNRAISGNSTATTLTTPLSLFSNDTQLLMASL
ncbi:uncharacterized protein LOC108047844 [Drosophila rhopaloa]|uniref:Uncharacterized protein LOC108047844 n=1 Tax=Drosophila rhopaloa TaxID=1041015 RepID=A0A6P4F3V3_DRORH|nr:uncharacterized protein LOC108047844 [Drosophila rhopaloa]XP_016983695.1 uncharacterized protein LOC108047844 [Drosophila rhopaloa]XP_016983696.1 uncharacterized protein LOC108047844 [Drosophila rhopaloa]